VIETGLEDFEELFAGQKLNHVHTVVWWTL